MYVRTYAENEFVPGEEVFYNRRATKGWKGAAKMLGKDNDFVLIRHGGAFYRCHPCHLMKKEEEDETTLCYHCETPLNRLSF